MVKILSFDSLLFWEGSLEIRMKDFYQTVMTLSWDHVG